MTKRDQLPLIFNPDPEGLLSCPPNAHRVPGGLVFGAGAVKVI